MIETGLARLPPRLPRILVEAVAVMRELVGLTRWCLCLWGAWFVAGVLAFTAATVRYLRRYDGRREVRRYGAVGALVALLLSLLSTAGGIG